MKSTEEYYEELYDVDEITLLSLFERIQKEAYNQAIDDAAKNALVEQPETNTSIMIRNNVSKYDSEFFIVDKQSILKLKK